MDPSYLRAPLLLGASLGVHTEGDEGPEGAWVVEPAGDDAHVAAARVAPGLLQQRRLTPHCPAVRDGDPVTRGRNADDVRPVQQPRLGEVGLQPQHTHQPLKGLLVKRPAYKRSTFLIVNRDFLIKNSAAQRDRITPPPLPMQINLIKL